LAHQCARNEKNAVDKVNKILDRAGLHMDNILDRARDRRVKELVKEYARRESDTVTLINELLTGAGKSIDILMAEALAENLDYVERRPPDRHCREPPQRQSARDRPPSAASWRNAAAERATD
jgi:hypothetical protein